MAVLQEVTPVLAALKVRNTLNDKLQHSVAVANNFKCTGDFCENLSP